jgi:hypothetical protein
LPDRVDEVLTVFEASRALEQIFQSFGVSSFQKISPSAFERLRSRCTVCVQG